MRRMIFLILSILKNESGSLILIINIFFDLIFGMYMGHAKALEKRSLNYQDMFNECVVAASLYWKILYTSVTNQEDQYLFAKMELFIILFYCFVNLIIIILASFHNNKKSFIYIFNIINLKYKLISRRF